MALANGRQSHYVKENINPKTWRCVLPIVHTNQIDTGGTNHGIFFCILGLMLVTETATLLCTTLRSRQQTHSASVQIFGFAACLCMHKIAVRAQQDRPQI